MKMDWSLAMIPYGESWRKRRKVFTQYLSPNTVQTSDPVIVDFIRNMLPQLLESPDELFDIIHQYDHPFELDSKYSL